MDLALERSGSWQVLNLELRRSFTRDWGNKGHPPSLRLPRHAYKATQLYL